MQAMKHMEPQVKQALEASKSASDISGKDTVISLFH